MTRAIGLFATAIFLVACAPPLDFAGPPLLLELPQTGDTVADAKAAIEIAKTVCKVPALKSWLSKYSWRAELHHGNWHVLLPSTGYGLKCPDFYIDIRAADGGAADECMQCVVVTAD